MFDIFFVHLARRPSAELCIWGIHHKFVCSQVKPGDELTWSCKPTQYRVPSLRAVTLTGIQRSALLRDSSSLLHNLLSHPRLNLDGDKSVY